MSLDREWTTESPTESGWYFWREAEGHQHYAYRWVPSNGGSCQLHRLSPINDQGQIVDELLYSGEWWPIRIPEPEQ